MPANTTELEKRLWGAADELRANSKLKSSEYSVPVLGLIFLRYADHKFATAQAKLTSQGSGRRTRSLSIGRPSVGRHHDLEKIGVGKKSFHSFGPGPFRQHQHFLGGMFAHNSHGRQDVFALRGG